ncbi:MAG: nitroreductase [Gammaproteobacteria bacterium]
MNTVDDTIKKRHATRGFLDKPVSHELIEQILEAARWAPSGVNSQPWNVAVVEGKTKQSLADHIISARESNHQPNPDYQYYPDEWKEPYKSRRKDSGLALYRALKIRREDTEKQKQAWYNNYQFFGAPVGLIFYIDKQLNKGSWLDMGMFLENVMLVATSMGLSTCPQAALAEYPDIVRKILNIDEQYHIVCGMALGYADESHPANSYRLKRAPVEEFTRWFK